MFTSGFVPDLDREIDAWPNALLGFHAIEAKLFGAKRTDVKPETDALIFHLEDLDVKVHHLHLAAATPAQRHRAARLRDRRKQGRWRRVELQRHLAQRHAQQRRRDRAGLSRPSSPLPSTRAIPSSRRQFQEKIDELKALVEVPDLKSLDPEKLRAASEELIVLLQTAAPEIGLRTPSPRRNRSVTGEAARAPSQAFGCCWRRRRRFAWCWRCRSRRRAFPGARQADGAAGRNRAQRGCAGATARDLPIGSDRRRQILSRQSWAIWRSARRTILGGVARQAGISCSTCHVNGASNRQALHSRLCRPGRARSTRRAACSTRKADNHVLDPVTIPSLRGARYLAPYGHDGRMASLRDFVRNVIVNEFAGPEPSPAVLDAMVVYIQDIDFLPNPRVGPGGRLTALASDAERRGETLFAKPFPHDPGLSCAGCHVPSAAFVDHRQHDVGSGRLVQDADPAERRFQRALFSRRALRHLRSGGGAFRSRVRSRSVAAGSTGSRRLSDRRRRRRAAL